MSIQSSSALDAIKRKKQALFLAAGAALLLIIVAIVLYKTYGQNLASKLSPLDPRSAQVQVPINKDMVAEKKSDKSKNSDAASIDLGVTQAMASDTLQESKPIAQATPAALLPEAGPTQTLPGIPTEPPAQVSPPAAAASAQVSELEKLDARMAKIEAAITSMVNKLSACDTPPSKLNTHAVVTEAATSSSPKAPTPVAHPKPRHLAVARAPLPALSAPVEIVAPAPAPDVLAVDIWNGKPSVVVRSAPGADVQFLTEGDKVGNYTMKRADRDGQRAAFISDSGRTTVQQAEQ
jgi:hypothetical protein